MNTMTDAAGKVQGWAFCRAAHVRQRAKELLDALDTKLERIEIVRAELPVFYATVVVLAGGGEHRIDARPSDAIALAVRSNAPMFVEDDIMNRLGTVSPVAEEVDDEQEFEKFDEFVHTLSPDDF